jgi:hypothetical protein
LNYNNANNFADSNLLNQKNNNIRDAFVKKLAEEETEEFSTEEKTRFSNNLKDLKKSYVLRSSQSQFNNLSLNDCEETAKISYKFMSKADRELAEKKIIQTVDKLNKIDNISNSKQEQKFYWFAAYDKLIKTKNVKKILKYFEEGEEELNKNDIIKEQAIILKDFEIYFEISNDSTRPYIINKKVN